MCADLQCLTRLLFFVSDVHSLNTGTFGPYAQISDEELGYFSYVYSLDFGIFGKNAQTSDQKHCDLSELPDIHSLYIVIFVPYALIYDEGLI
jgi:hypothetical protein